MRFLRRLFRWAGVSVAIALLFLVVEQASSAVSPLLVLRTQGIGFGDYYSPTTDLAPLSSQVVDDARRDTLTTLGSGVLAVAPPVQTQPHPAATPAPSVIPSSAATGSVTGTVQDSQTGIGIANGLVSVNPSGLSTLASSNGAFGFPVLPAGDYTITASAAGYQPASATLTVTANHNANLNLHLVSTSPAGSVVGVIRSDATGKGLAGATVTLTPGPLVTVTDSSGSFGFATVAPGTYTLTVTASGYQVATQTIAVKVGHTTQGNLSLTPV